MSEEMKKAIELFGAKMALEGAAYAAGLSLKSPIDDIQNHPLFLAIVNNVNMGKNNG